MPPVNRTAKQAVYDNDGEHVEVEGFSCSINGHVIVEAFWGPGKTSRPSDTVFLMYTPEQADALARELVIAAARARGDL